MKIIQEAKYETETHHDIYFHYVGNEDWGFDFPCNADGHIIEPLNQAARENYEACLTGMVRGTPVVRAGMRTYTNSYRIPAVGRCQCGRLVDLYGFTNTCDCGRDYNMDGSLLAPREQWGDETGESVVYILRIR